MFPVVGHSSVDSVPHNDHQSQSVRAKLPTTAAAAAKTEFDFAELFLLHDTVSKDDTRQ